MAWRRLAPVAAALLLAALAAAPAATAHERDGTTSTGDVDTYRTWPTTEPQYCPAIYTTWEVTLSLHEPVPGDRVLLSSQGTIDDVADAALATYDDSTVHVRVDHNGCPPPADVVGLTVSGDVGYDISWRSGVGY